MNKKIFKLFVFLFGLAILNINCDSNPLMEAAAEQNIDRIKLLIEAGYPVDQVDKDGWTALHYAARFGKRKSVLLLIQKGANLNKLDMLYEDSPLHHAVIGNHLEIVDLLLKHGANPNIRNGTIFQEASTPLFMALDNPILLRILLKYDADPYIVNKNKKSPIDIALKNGKNQVIKLLQESKPRSAEWDINLYWQMLVESLAKEIDELNSYFDKLKLTQLPEKPIVKKEKKAKTNTPASSGPTKTETKKKLDLSFKKENYKKIIKKITKSERELPQGYDTNPLMAGKEHKNNKTNPKKNTKNNPEVQQTINGISKKIASWEKGTRLIVHNRGPKAIIITSVTINPVNKKNKKGYTKKTSIFIKPQQRMNILNVSHGLKDRFSWSFRFKVIGKTKEFHDPLEKPLGTGEK